MTFNGLAFGGGQVTEIHSRMDENREAFGLEIIRHPAAPADEHRRGRMLRHVDQNPIVQNVRSVDHHRREFARRCWGLHLRIGYDTWPISTSWAVCRKAISRKATRVDSLKKF